MPVIMYVVSLPAVSGSYDLPEQPDRCIFSSDEAVASGVAASAPGGVHYAWGVNTFGSEYNYAVSEEISSTISGTYQQKLRLTVSGISGGEYKVNWSLEQDSLKATIATGYRVQINDTTTLVENVADKPSADQYHQSSGFSIKTLVSGTYNIDLDYKTESGNGAGTNIKNTRLDVWRVS